MLSKLNSGFLRSVLILLSGTALGHIITGLGLVITARIYSPEDFNVLAVFSSAVAILSVSAALRFDVAVTVAETKSDAMSLVKLSILCSAFIALALGIVISLLPDIVLHRLGLEPIGAFFWFLPIAVFLASLYSALQGWFVRNSDFPLISTSRIVQSASAAAGQIGFGYAGVGPFGLILGSALNTGVGCLTLGARFIRSEWSNFYSLSSDKLVKTFSSYNKYPRYSTLEAICNSAALQVPIIIIASLAVGPEAGYMMLAMTVMQAPMALVGTAVGQVYISQAPEKFRTKDLAAFTLKTLAGLNKTGTGPLIFAALIAPNAFALVFGEQWRRSGEIVAWMTPWFIMQFLTAPLSMSIYVTGHQRLGLILQMAGLVLRVGFILLAYFWLQSELVEAYALSGFLFYLCYLFIVLSVVDVRSAQAIKVLFSAFAFIICWVALALLVDMVFTYLLGGSYEA